LFIVLCFQRSPQPAAAGRLFDCAQFCAHLTVQWRRAQHPETQFEIGGDKPCSQDLSEKVRLAETLSGLLPSGPLYVQLGLPCAVDGIRVSPCLPRPKVIASVTEGIGHEQTFRSRAGHVGHAAP